MIENLGPFTRANSEFPNLVQSYIVQEQQLKLKKMPVYSTIKDALKARRLGTSEGSLSEEGSWALTRRGLRPVGEGTGWTWSTDQQLRITGGLISEEQVVAVLLGVKCPVMLVIAIESHFFDLDSTKMAWVDWKARLRALRLHTTLEIQKIHGGHHLHMDDDIDSMHKRGASICAEKIKKFIDSTIENRKAPDAFAKSSL